MANFVEKATLKLVDETSANAKKINASLKQLFATAKSFKSASKSFDIHVNTGTAQNKIRGIANDISRLASRAPKVTIRVDSSQVNLALSRLRALNSIAGKSSRSISPSLSASHHPSVIAARSQAIAATAQARAQALATVANARAAAIAARVPAVPSPGVRPSSRRRALGGGNAGAGARGFASGVGIPGLGTSLANFDAGLVAVTTAAYAAGRALQSIADNAKSRDRSQLQTATVLTKAQKEIVDRNNSKPDGNGPISFTKDERSQLAASMVGDMQGTREQRAQSAINITKMLEKEFLPRQFAASPTKSREENIAGLRELIKAANIGSSDLVDEKTGNISADGKRVLDAIQIAKAADPELSNTLIKSTMANLKTSAFQLGTDGLAQVLINAGNDGVRVANEAFRSQKSLTGTTDNKTLNNALAALGVLKGVKRNDKNNVIAGSGTVVDEALLGTDPSAWIQKNLAPIIEERAKKNASLENRPVTQNDRVQAATKTLPGMSSAAINGITKMMLGFEQNLNAIDQAKAALEQKPNDVLTKSWTAQAEAVGIAWKDRAAQVGDDFAKAISADKMLGGIADILNGKREVSSREVAAGIGGAGVLGAAGIGASRALLTALNPLNGSAVALTGSATALSGAAAALSGAAGVQGAGNVAATAAKAAGGAATVAGGLTVGGIVAAGAQILAVGAGIAALSATAREFNKSIADTPRDVAHNRGRKAAAAAKAALIADRDEVVARNQKRDDASNAEEIGKKLFEQFLVRANAESVISKAKTALEENKAKEQTPEVANNVAQLQNTIDLLSTRIVDMNKIMSDAQAEKKSLTSPADASVFDKGTDGVSGLEQSMKVDELMKIGSVIDASMVKGNETIGSGLDTGFSAGAQKIIESGNGMGQAILGLAPTIGNAIGSAAGSAITAAVQSISVNIKNAGGGVNTGPSKPIE